MMNSSEYKNAIRELLEENGINYTTYNSNGAYDGIFTTERKHHPKKGDNAYQHFIFVGNPGNYPVNIIDEISPDMWQTYNSGTRAHVGESFEGLSRKSYAEGGEVKPDPLEVLKRSRPKAAGIPINDPPIENVFSPLDVVLGTSYKLMPFVNKSLPNYGSTLGALVLGADYNKTGNQPLMTKKLDPDVSEFYKDIVIPMNPNDEVYKQYFMKQFGNPNIEVHP